MELFPRDSVQIAERVGFWKLVFANIFLTIQLPAVESDLQVVKLGGQQLRDCSFLDAQTMSTFL
jgi:hypothetical protein